MYKVVKRFVDLQDNNYKYEAGDEYPRLGYEPSLVRINELSTKNNLQKAILIKDFEDIDEKEVIDLEKNDEITEETEKPKRGRKKKK